MKNSERGLTLIEVLATLSILSIVSVIIWSVFFQGYNYSQKAVSKNLMIQETNILISNLTRIHQASSSYKIASSGSDKCEITITSKKIDKVTNLEVDQPAQVFKNDQICFHFTIDIKNKDITDPDLIKPNKSDVSLAITTSDRNHSENKVSTDTYLYRLKGVGY